MEKTNTALALKAGGTPVCRAVLCPPLTDPSLRDTVQFPAILCTTFFPPLPLFSRFYTTPGLCQVVVIIYR